mmetsp:Transcript_6204/g.9064  ORF Transcript_6204/g.9064 Transcript_6204/m.9064 type:complete len:435 (+) Transcript_6204:59-1363(+)
MFSWANEQLSKLADTVLAPVPENTPSLRFLSACSSGDESTATTCLSELASVQDIIGNPSKGMQPIHYAALYGMIGLLTNLLTNYGVPVDTFDYQGNTALHHACSGKNNPLQLIQFLVEQHQASVVVKNSQGLTPYDVATGVSIRSYLLPRQLQQETMTALQNGGQGLVPGMDMGGYTLPSSQPSHHLPPPTSSSTSSIPHSEDTTLVPPTFPPPPPTSSSSSHQHARYNTSSAPTSANLRYRPDGFHSSASDLSLQAKYGHHVVAPGSAGAVVPPPPLLVAPPRATTSAATAMPPPPFTYSSTTATTTTTTARYPTASRYLAYDAITGQSMALPPAASTRNRTQQQQQQQQVPQQFQVFAPPSTEQNQQSNEGGPTINHSSAPPPMMTIPPPQQRQYLQQQQPYPSAQFHHGNHSFQGQTTEPVEGEEEDSFVS